MGTEAGEAGVRAGPAEGSLSRELGSGLLAGDETTLRAATGDAPLSDEGTAGPASVPPFPVPGWDRYRCLRFLGQGGMGNVFLARDVRLQRDVAVKFVRGDDRSHVHRLLIEARAQARVDHECVCRVYEVGEIHGHVYIAMHYVDGKRLDLWAPELSFEQKAMVLREAALGLHAAHAVGVVHRDIKPANILVERLDNGLLKPFVMDFGIAHLRAAGGTETGTVLGTPHYMAPEQARGETVTLDRRADVYGLGATLYFLLTGTPPLGSGQMVDVLSRIAAEEPLPPREINHDVPAELSAIALKCLQKERSLRYGSARDLAEDLDRFLHGEPVTARHASALDPYYRWLRKRWRGATAVAFGSCALAFAAGWGSSMAREVSERENLHRRFTELATDVEAVARYSALAPLHNTGEDRKRLTSAMEDLAASVAKAGPTDEGSGHYALGLGHLALDELDQAEPHLDAAWKQDVRGPRIAQALILVKGQRYRSALLESSSLGDPTARAAQVRELALAFRAAQTEYLRSSARAVAPAEHYMAALAAHYEGRPAEALENLDALGSRLPWLYEAPRLRGDILLARALSRMVAGDHRGARVDFDEGRRAYTEAAAIGQSVPSLHEALAELSCAEMELAATNRDDPMPAFQRGIEAVARALAIEPAREIALRLAARLKLLLAERHAVRPAPSDSGSTCRSTSVDASNGQKADANCSGN